MKNFIFIIVLTLIGFTSLQAQPLNKETLASMITTAEEQEALHNYKDAYDWYKKASTEDPKDKSLKLKLAQLAYKIKDYKRAVSGFKSLLRRDKDGKYAEHRFKYARSLKMMGDYEAAIKEFDKYLSSATDPVEKELAELEKQGAEYAMVAKQDPDLTISNAGKGVNTRDSEYSPFMGVDGKSIYFSSLIKENEKEIVVVDEKNTDYHAKIKVATAGEKGWENPTVLDEGINRPGYFNTHVHITSNGKQMFFCRQLLDGTGQLKESKIYVSNYRDGGWGAANEVTGVNGEYLSKAPAVGELFGKKVLFFASNMDGGEGQFDIYYANEKEPGVYGDPVNLGPRMNTIGNEIDPFYRDGLLYFSSDGHPGLGGYDIFKSEWTGRWSDPTNMGKGFNSSVDDLGFMLDNEGYRGLLTSNRIVTGAKSLHSKTCCEDIYNINLRKIVADLKVVAFDANEKTPLNGVTIQLVEIEDDKPAVIDSKTNSSGNSFDFPLELGVAYKIIATAENFKPDTVEFATVGLLDNKTFEEMVNLVPLPKTITITSEEPIVLENILYDFNKDNIRTDAEPSLEFIFEILNEYPDMKIELSSHTDARGGDAANQSLAQRRAESARRWLLNRQEGAIKRFRIVAKGYGETVPQTVDAKLAARHSFLKEGTVLTEEYINTLPTEEQQEAAHQINRRTEFKIIDGPKSIIIEETRLIQLGNKKVDEVIEKSKDKKTLPKEKTSQQSSNPEIHRWSSLYGRKALKGLPIMQFDNRMHNMGTVKKGEKKEHTFKFKNVGDTTLEIDLINTCDCTVAEESRKVVKPGETGEIHVVFDSTEKETGETIDIDIFMKNRTPGDDMPIIETIKYEFEIEK